MYNLRSQDQRGPPLNASKRAHYQPRTGVTEAIRGAYQQPRTDMRHTIIRKRTNKTINVCTYNPRKINDMNTEAFDIMLRKLENVNWDVIGFSETKEKE